MDLQIFSPAHSCNPMLFGGFTSIEASIVEVFADIHAWFPRNGLSSNVQMSSCVPSCAPLTCCSRCRHTFFSVHNRPNRLFLCSHYAFMCVLNILIVVSFAHWCQIMSFWTSQLFNCCFSFSCSSCVLVSFVFLHSNSWLIVLALDVLACFQILSASLVVSF